MKHIKKFSLFSLFALAALSNLRGQTLDELRANSWLERQVALQVLETKTEPGLGAQDPSKTSPAKTVEVSTVFQNLAFGEVAEKIRASKDVPDAIVEGFDAAVSISKNTPSFEGLTEDDRKRVFEVLLTVLKD